MMSQRVLQRVVLPEATMVLRWCVVLLLCVGVHSACAECRDSHIPGIPSDAVEFVFGSDTTYWQVFAMRDSGAIELAGTKRWEMLGQINRIFRRGGQDQSYLTLTVVLDTNFGKEASAVVLHCGGGRDTVICFARDENVAAWPSEERIIDDHQKRVRVYTFLVEITPNVEQIRTALNHVTIVFDNGRSITSHNPHPEKFEAVVIPTSPVLPDPPHEWSPRAHAPGHSLL